MNCKLEIAGTPEEIAEVLAKINGGAPAATSTAAPAEEKPKRKRRTKAEIAADKAAEEAAKAPAPAPDPMAALGLGDTAPAAEELTLDSVRAVAVEVMKAAGQTPEIAEKVSDVFKAHGADNLSGVKPADYASVIDQLRAL